MLATLVAPGLPSQSLACHEEAQQKSSEMRLLLLTALTQVVKMRDDLRKDIDAAKAEEAATAARDVAHQHPLGHERPESGARSLKHLATEQAAPDAANQPSSAAEPAEETTSCAVSLFANTLFQPNSPGNAEASSSDEWGTWVAAIPSSTPRPDCPSPTHSTPTSKEAAAAALGGDAQPTLDQSPTQSVSARRRALAKAQDTPLRQALNKVSTGAAGRALGVGSRGARVTGDDGADDVCRAGSDQSEGARGSHGAATDPVPLVFPTTATVPSIRTSQGISTGVLSALLESQQANLRTSSSGARLPHLRGNALYDSQAWDDSTNSDNDADHEHGGSNGSGRGVRMSGDWDAGAAVQRSVRSAFEPRMLLGAVTAAAEIKSQLLLRAGAGNGGSDGPVASPAPSSPASPTAAVASRECSAQRLASLSRGVIWITSDVAEIPWGTVSNAKAKLESCMADAQGKGPAGGTSLSRQSSARTSLDFNPATPGVREVSTSGSSAGGSKIGRMFSNVTSKVGRAFGGGNRSSGAVGAQQPGSTGAIVQRTAVSDQVMRRPPGYAARGARQAAVAAKAAGAPRSYAPEVDLRAGAAADLMTQAQWEGGRSLF